MTLLLAGLALFLGAHGFVRFEGPREALRSSLGPGPYKLLFSLLSLGGFALIVIGYGAYRAAGPVVLWTPPSWTHWITAALTLPAFILLVSSYAGGALKAWTVHPQLAAVKLWAAGHLASHGDAGSLLMFAGFLAWALFARIRLGKAERATVAWTRTDTTVVLGGVVTWLVFVRWGHAALIGVPALAW